MNLIFTALGALPIGLLVQRRGAAVLTFLALDSFLFSFQTLNVLLTWMSGDQGLGGGSGFGTAPSGTFPVVYDHNEVLGYGLVNLLITSTGVGLVVLGTRLRARRSEKRRLAVPARAG